MKIKVECLKSYLADYITCQIDDFEIDESAIADSVALRVLSEIQTIIQNDNYSDFYIVEGIVQVFEKYHLDAGSCHDFG